MAADFDALYQELAPEVVRRLRRGFSYRGEGGERRFISVPSAFDREDITQEAFARLHVQIKRGTFDASRPARPYLHRIVFFVALEHLGRASRLQPTDDLDASWQEGASAETPESALLEGEKIELQRRFLSTLDDRERGVYDLTLVGTESQAAAALQLGLSRDQVYRLGLRVREKFAGFLRERGWFGDA